MASGRPFVQLTRAGIPRKITSGRTPHVRYNSEGGPKVRTSPHEPSFASFPKPSAKAPPPPPSSAPASARNKAANEPGATVLFPKTRIAIGVVFLGSMAYSMISDNRERKRKEQASALQQQTEPPSIADRDALTKRESGVTENSPMRLRMQHFIESAQQQIVSELQQLEPSSRFRVDKWTRPNGGGGTSCVLQDGQVFEKAGVNTSIVYGVLPRPAIQKMRVNHKALDPDVESLEFFAAGISLVLHPVNPMAPTVHLNYRYFETANADGSSNAWWFGGGTDLTPSYLFDEDVIHFHRTIKEACDRHDKGYYPRFKTWCDKYFYIPHRKECRGVGGIFFDDLDQDEKDQEQLFSFVNSCLDAFMPSYLPIVNKRKDAPYTAEEKRWQQLRRGRYVEFNLVHDRGTKFGLETPGARVESILMSLPLTGRWEYGHEPTKGGREERLLSVLRESKEWV